MLNFVHLYYWTMDLELQMTCSICACCLYGMFMLLRAIRHWPESKNSYGHMGKSTRRVQQKGWLESRAQEWMSGHLSV